MKTTDHHLAAARRMISTIRASANNGTLDIESFDARMRAVEEHLTAMESAIASGNPPLVASVPHLGCINGLAP